MIFNFNLSKYYFFALTIAVLLVSFISNDAKAQAGTMDFGNLSLTPGSVSSGVGTSITNVSGPTAGTFFYGFSSTGSTIQGRNPGLLELGSFTELQASAGSGTNFTKFGTFNYAAANAKTQYTKFEFVLGDLNGGNTATSGTWYFFAGDGGTGKLMLNNTTALNATNILEMGVAIRFTFGSNGAITAAYRDFNTGTYTTIPNITFVQGRKYYMEIYSDNDKQGSFNYTRKGTTYTCNWSKMDIWVDGNIVANQINVSQYIGQPGNSNNLKKMDSYGFYGEGSSNAWIFVDNINGAEVGTVTFTDYYSKSTGDLHTPSTWNTNVNGTGTDATVFSNNYCTYYLVNRTSTSLTGNLTITGTDSRMVVGNGIDAIDFTIPSNFGYTGTIDVSNNAKLIFQNITTIPFFGVLNNGSTVEYSYAGNQDIAYPKFYNLITGGSTGTKTLTTNVSALGTITAGNGLAGTLSTSTFGLSGNINVGANYTLNVLSSSANASNLVFGSVGTGSTVEYGSADASQSVFAADYYNLTFSGNTKTLTSTGTIGINNTFNPGSVSGHTVTGSKINFNGSGSAQSFTSSYDFIFNKLTVSNALGLNVGSNITVNDSLYLPISNQSTTKGALDLSTFTLTMGPLAENTGTGDVTGIVKRTSISANEIYTFGHPYTTLTFSSGTLPTSVSVKTVLNTFPFTVSPRQPVNRYYDIINTGTPDNSVNVRLHFLDTELNGNTASDLNMFDYHISGSSWHDHGRANISTSERWVSENLTTSYVAQNAFGTKYWTLSNSTEPIFLWTGSISTDWNDTRNWAGGVVPTTTSYVVIPDASTTSNDPILPSSPEAVIKKLLIQSGGILNGGSGTLTLSGSAGAWQNQGGTFNYSTSTVKFTGASATISGTTDFCGIVIDNGATLTPLTNSYLGVNCTFTKVGTGALYASTYENTIDYKGTGDQDVLVPNDGYHNLQLSNNGKKILSSNNLKVLGNFTTSGSASAVTPTGTPTVEVEGNFTNDGSFTAGTTTIEMKGTVGQTIGGSVPTSFNNLRINNVKGVTLSQNVTVDGTFEITSGDLDIGNKTLTLNGNVTAGTNIIKSTNCGTVVYGKSADGQNVLPGNYGSLSFSNNNKVLPSSGDVKIACTFTPGSATGHTISNSSVEFNGTGAQTVPVFNYNNLTISNTGSNITLASGTVKVSGNFSSSSSTVNSISGNEIDFNGSSQQSVSAFNFNNMKISNSAGVKLLGDCFIDGSLNFTSGILDTYNSTVFFKSTASHTAELSTSYILGTAVMQSRNIGTGTLNFLNCNIETGSTLGDVYMTRVTGPNGAVNVNSSKSIQCTWDIIPSVTFSGSRSVTYSWPVDLDNGLIFNSVQGRVYYYNDITLEWEPVDIAKTVSTSSNIRSISISTTHFSIYTVSNADNPLPVTLSSFTSNLSERNVKLNWTSTKEINNAGFEIERAENYIENLVYNKIGFVSGKGNSNNPVSYSFTDYKLSTGKYKYRLKQIDYNGNFEYFALNNEVEIGIPRKFNLSQNYPNPFNPVTKIDFDLPLNSKINLVIYDVSGREVKTLLNEERKAGYHTMTFNAANTLASGVYFYRLIAKSSEKDFVSVKRMVLVK